MYQYSAGRDSLNHVYIHLQGKCTSLVQVGTSLTMYIYTYRNISLSKQGENQLYTQTRPNLSISRCKFSLALSSNNSWKCSVLNNRFSLSCKKVCNTWALFMAYTSLSTQAYSCRICSQYWANLSGGLPRIPKL